MRQLKPAANMFWASLFFFVAIFGMHGCGDANNVTGPPPPTPLSPDAKLSSLIVSPGALEPEFSSEVLPYTVDVLTTVTSITVTATPQNASASMTINGEVSSAGQVRTIRLGVAGSSTFIQIVVTAVNGSQNTYTVTVNRAAPGGNSNLRSLTVSPGTLVPAFLPNTTNYTVDVASSVASVTVTAQPQDAGATVSINSQPRTSGSISLGAAGSNTVVTIEVEALNGNLKTYLVRVNRTALAGNNNLQSLTVSPGTLVPAFAPSTTSYTVSVASSVASVTVTARAQDAGATVSINGQTATSRSISLGAAGSSTTVSLIVTAPNGSQKTYLVTVNRTALGGNNNLQSLTVSPGILVPAFAASTTSYTVDVATSVTSVTVTAQAQDAGATLSINGQSTTSRSVALGTPGSSTTVSLIVTAPNGSQKTYLVTVNRTALGGNNNLQSLTVSPGTLVPAFVPSRTSYTVDVASSVSSVTVAATLQDSAASMTVNGQGTSSGQARTITLNGPGLSTLVTIDVEAPNGSQKTYFVTVNRTALGGNNNLQSLTVSPGILVPAFAASTTSYTVDVATSVASVTVTAQPQDAGATVSINGQPATSRSVSLGAAGSSTLVTIEVTAPNGSQKTYLVTVNRTALGGNNNLQNLTVSPGTLVPAFVPSRTSYTVDVASSVSSVTVAATLQDTSASMTVNGQGTSSGQARAITLNGPGFSTLVTIDVEAPNGSQKTYFVTVNRTALAGNNNLQSLTVSPGTLVPVFVPSTTSYTVSVASSVASVTVTAQPQDAGATVSIESQTTTSRSISLGAAGSTTQVTIEVTAQNGSQKTYTVFVNRAAIVPSGNNNLSDLAVSAGALAPAFDAAITSYNVAAPNITADTTVTATEEHSAATVTINGSPATSGVPSPSIALVVGANSIPIVVTAENGATKTYTVTITREGP